MLIARLAWVFFLLEGLAAAGLITLIIVVNRPEMRAISRPAPPRVGYRYRADALPPPWRRELPAAPHRDLGQPRSFRPPGAPVMTVYVDDWRQQARVGRVRGEWSHLTVGPDGGLDELHAFAAKVGLRRAWFQDKPWPSAHSDVTEPKRQQAIAAGSVAITGRDAARQRDEALAKARPSRPGEGTAKQCGAARQTVALQRASTEKLP